MDIRGLRVVLAIAEHGSVVRAAATLHVSPSSVSHTLVGVETELGVELFHRLPRGMALTDAGNELIAPARRVLQELEQVRSAVDAVQGLVRGHVSVVAMRSFTVPLADLIGAFGSQYPEVVVEVLPPESVAVVARWVREGRCELGFTRSADVPADLESTPIAVERTVLVVPDGHPLSGRATVSMAELTGERIVAPPATSSMRPLFDAYCRRCGVEPHVVAEAATHEMVLELVRAGVGCALAPELSVAPVLSRGASTVCIDELGKGTLVEIVYRRGRELTSGARALRDLAAARFAGG